MVVFEAKFDLETFQECLKYVQDSLDWLIASEEDNYYSNTSAFTPAFLDQTTVTFKTLQLRLDHLSRNARVPINRLPSEIFGHIFLNLKDRATPFPNPAIGARSCRLPSLGSWHRPSLVCRRWRREVLDAPELWTTIRVSDRVAVLQWVNTWLARSGALPLTIIFDTRLRRSGLEDAFRTFFNSRSTLEDALHILLDSGRVRALSFHQSVTQADLNSVLVSVAGQLETLSVMAGGPGHTSVEGFFYELPRMRVLSVSQGVAWRAWSMHELRHLSLTCCPDWSLQNLRDFLAMLAANTQLEELMLCNIYFDSFAQVELAAFIEQYQSVPMPKLRQLLVEEYVADDLCSMADILDKTISLPSTCTRYLISNSLRLERGGAYPVTRLVIGPNFQSLIGTDGISACIVNMNYSGFSMPPIDKDQVQELWVGKASYQSIVPRVASIMGMRNVKKLVVELGKPAMKAHRLFQKLGSIFSAVNELHLLVEHNDIRVIRAVLQFLTRRKRNGLQVNTLHLISDVSIWTTLNCWREGMKNFRDQVNEVSHEEVEVRQPSGCCEEGTSLFTQLIPERFGLPEACKHPSPTSALWQPWHSYVVIPLDLGPAQTTYSTTTTLLILAS